MLLEDTGTRKGKLQQDTQGGPPTWKAEEGERALKGKAPVAAGTWSSAAV